MIKEYDVIGLGVNAINQVVYVDRLPNAPIKLVCPPQRYTLFDGGAMGNTLTGLARLGLKTGYLGKIGGDRFGLMIKASCMLEGIDLSHCQILPDGQSAWNWILRDEQGQRITLLFPNILTQIDEIYVTANSYYIKLCRLFHVEASAIRLKPLLVATKIAKSGNIPVMFSLDLLSTSLVGQLKLGTQEELEELIALSDYLILSLDGAKELTQQQDPQEMAMTLREKYLIPYVVIWHLGNGCFIATETEVLHSPAFPVVSIDDTGADDAFRAGMIFGIINGWELRETIKFANAYGALNTLKIGARSGMGVEAEVRQFMEEN